jgi:hypothetical protein
MSKLDQNLQIDGRAPSFSELVGGLPQPRHPIAPPPRALAALLGVATLPVRTARRSPLDQLGNISIIEPIERLALAQWAAPRS